MILVDLGRKIMFCGKCGNQIAVGGRFCGNCGWQVPNVKQTPSKPVCKSCGAELKEGIKFCGVCGAKTVKDIIPQIIVEQPEVEAVVKMPVEPVVKPVNRTIRITTPEGTMEFKSTGKADETFLHGSYKIEVFADNEPCGSAAATVATKEKYL